MSRKTASISRINVHRACGGYTLVELMVGMSLAFILMAGIIAAYLFLGRNLTRLVNLQDQEVKTRHAMRVFSQDVSVATQLTAASSTISGGVTTDATFTATIPTQAGPATYVRYTYSSSAGTLVRYRDDIAETTKILTNITSFAINYFTTSQVLASTQFSTTAAAPATATSVKAIQFQFTTKLGSNASGTEEVYTMLSPRVLLRNHVTLPLL